MIVALGGHAVIAEQIRQRLSRAWSGPAGSAAFTISDSFTTADAVVLISDCAVSQSATLALFDHVEETSCPVLALLDDIPLQDNFYTYAGAMVERWTAEDARLVALLEGMLHRQSDVKRLRCEAALTQRFQGGLKGQITKIHEELQLAALVQREFLPREVPTMHGVEFAAMWRPTNYVSGDIYDLIRLDEDHVGVFVADAVGHGVPAALMTMVICRSLVTKEIFANSYRLVPPGEVLSRLNAEMIRSQGQTTRFATAVYALIDCRRRTVQLAGAGHPPPVRLFSDGASQSLETRGGLLGVFPDEVYEQIQFDLAIGDRLLLYTDGFEQAFPADSGDDHNRRLPTTQYRREFDRLSTSATAADMIDFISRRVDDQAGSLHQVDDLTLICVHAGKVQCPGEGAVAIDDARSTHRTTIPSRPTTGLRLAS
jgi:sigma-B regulation protein RsbU (phosphoserine phosphatase)